jgi:predicted dehydrogenase
VNNPNPLKVIQMGLGKFGRSWFQSVLGQEPAAEVVACVDTSEESLATLRRETDFPASRCFNELSSALESVSADCAVVTASLPGHVPSAMAALGAGLHVLMEKPFAESEEAAHRVVEEAQRRNLTLMISQNYRFFPAPQHARLIVQEKRLGELGVIHVDFRRDHVRRLEQHSSHFVLADPLLVDMAIHHFDLMRMVTGQEASRVRCSTWNPPYSSYQDPPAAELAVEMANGLFISYRGSWCSTGEMTPWAGVWHMEFENGEAVWESRADQSGKTDRFQIRRFGDGATGRKPHREKLPRIPATDRAGSLKAFVNAVRTGVEPDTSGRRNIGSIALTYAALRASKSGAWETVPRI